MGFLVIEGLDGSGKSTQVDLLCKDLEKHSIKYKYLHFPRLEEGVYGKLIARFLRGELGSLDHVDPYLVALIFAGDRNDAKAQIERWIKEDYLVIVDRYVYSNIAFQCAKFKDFEKQKELAEWIMGLEYNYHKLPVPDKNIFLDVPFNFTKERLSEIRSGEDRDYLKGQQDIHEKDIGFQENVRKIYHSICLQMGKLTIVNCADESGKMKSPLEIFKKLKEIIEY
jgi:dTMP kinase